MSKERPYINFFQQTISQKYKNSAIVKSTKKSAKYRNELEILLGAVVKLECHDWKFVESKVDGKDCDKILLRNSSVIKAPTGRNVKLPIQIEHIWTIVDKDWKNRNKFSDGCYLECKGFIYEYISQGKKNIGFQSLSVKVK